MSDTVLSNIVRLVGARGISLAEACRRAGLATNYLSDKAGKANKAISDDILARFAEVLEVGIGELREAPAHSLDIEAPPAARSDDRRVRIPLAQLRLSDLNPRTEVDEDAISDLASAINEQGLLQNLVVRMRPRLGFADPVYEVVAGGCRLAALELLAHENILPADLAEGIPCLVVEGDDAAILVLGLVENIQRQAMNPMDEAHAIHRLNHDMGMSTAEIAASLGLSQRAVQQRLTFVTKLSPRHQAQLREGVITYRQALDLVQQHRAPEPPPAPSETVSPALPLPMCWRCGLGEGLQSTGLGTWICAACVAFTSQVHKDRAAQRERAFPDPGAMGIRGDGATFEIPAEVGPPRTCRVCGCTDNRACEGGCSWVGDTLCSKCQVVPDATDKAESDRLAAAIETAKAKFPPPVRVAPDLEYIVEVIKQELADGFPGQHVMWCLVAVPPWNDEHQPVIYAGSADHKLAQEAVTELSYVLDALAATGTAAPQPLTPEQLRARQAAAVAKLETQHAP